MKILVNTASLRSGGGLQVALSLLDEFAVRTGHRFAVLLSPQLAALVAENPYPEHLQFHRLSQNPAQSFSAMRRFRSEAAAVESAFAPDAVLTVFGPAWWRPAAPHLVGFANGIFLFNKSRFIRQIWPSGLLRRIKYFLSRKLIMRQLKREADALWVETATAELAMRQTLPGKSVHVVGNAVSASLLQHQNLPKKDAGPFRLLTLCAAHPNKNLELIGSLLPLLKEEPVEFVVTLPEADFNRIYPRPSPKLCNLGPVHPQSLGEVYAGCDAVFLPSWLETFSAAYPEAMAVQKPILASDLPFAHEICGEAALYFDPGNPADAAEAIRRLKSDLQLQQTLIAAGRERLSHFISAAERAEALVHLLLSLRKPASAVS